MTRITKYQSLITIAIVKIIEILYIVKYEKNIFDIGNLTSKQSFLDWVNLSSNHTQSTIAQLKVVGVHSACPRGQLEIVKAGGHLILEFEARNDVRLQQVTR
jgi:hypothetical protein